MSDIQQKLFKSLEGKGLMSAPLENASKSVELFNDVKGPRKKSFFRRKPLFRRKTVFRKHHELSPENYGD